MHPGLVLSRSNCLHLTFRWGEGPRVCPGKKFAQVEFVAVLATLFKDWSVRPQSRPGETIQQTRERVQAVLADSRVEITLQMRNPSSVGMVWKKRNEGVES